MKPISMICWSDKKGILTPIKFQISESSQEITIKIDKIIERTEEKLAGNRMYIFRCQSIIKNLERVFELKYDIQKCVWYLFKM